MIKHDQTMPSILTIFDHFCGVILDSWPAPLKPSCHINGLIRRIGGSAAGGDRWNGPRGPLFITAVGRTKIPCSGAHLWWRREGKILEKNLKNRKIMGSCWGSITMQNAAIFAQNCSARNVQESWPPKIHSCERDKLCWEPGWKYTSPRTLPLFFPTFLSSLAHRFCSLGSSKISRKQNHP